MVPNLEPDGLTVLTIQVRFVNTVDQLILPKQIAWVVHYITLRLNAKSTVTTWLIEYKYLFTLPLIKDANSYLKKVN